MISREYQEDLEDKVRNRIRRLRRSGKLTSAGERMSLAAIGRTLDPPVSRVAMYLVVGGKSESARIKAAIERELGQPYWPRNN